MTALVDRGAFDLQRLLTIEPGFLDEDPAEHQHDASIVSVSLRSDRPVSAERFSSWMRRLIRERGVDVLRTKGILHLLGQERRYVFQGVHMVMDSEWGPPWTPAEARESRLVFIGRHLDEAALRQGFNACLS